jgi:DNA-binding CsgD family transcriptional regulator
LLPTLDLLLPHLHITYVRAQSLERELATRSSSPLPQGLEGRAEVVTGRERQILHWVREGMSNQEIGTVLGISALTVKNHVQKILRKLGAANRAQAVAMALRTRLITAHGAEFDRAPSSPALEEQA